MSCIKGKDIFFWEIAPKIYFSVLWHLVLLINIYIMTNPPVKYVSRICYIIVPCLQIKLWLP